jgi:hypothetical protein
MSAKNTGWLENFLVKKLKGFLPYGNMVVSMIVSVMVLALVATDVLIDAAKILFFTSPLWLMYLAPATVTHYWNHYVRHLAMEDPFRKPVLYEILIPRDIKKSPKAMEIVFDSLHAKWHIGSSYHRRWRGHVPPVFTFELCSHEGEIHFYTYVWDWTKDRVEAALYSQFPNLKLVQIPPEQDYVRRFKGVPPLWGCNFKLTKGDAYPLKTYHDYELEKDPKPEHKSDPMLTILEQMATMEKGEYMWYQFMLQVEYQPNKKGGWYEQVQKEIEAIYARATPEYPTSDGKIMAGYPQIKPMEYELIKSMERSLTKHGFKVGIRGVYINMDGMWFKHSQMLWRMFFQYASDGGEYFNRLTQDPESGTSGFDWPWEDFMGIRRNARVKKLWDAYCSRGYFTPPHIYDPIILTAEEVATLYHFPGEESRVMGIHFLESKRGAAPVNLPE